MCFGSFRPVAGQTPAEQLADLGRQVDALLAVHGFKHSDIVKQAYFLRRRTTKRDAQSFLREYFTGVIPATSFISQPPAGGEEVALEILAIQGANVRVERVNENLTIVRDADRRWAYVAGVEPAPGVEDTYAQSYGCFAQMHDLLAKAGFHFDLVVRTWIYERGIIACDKGPNGEAVQRYQILNDARRQFFTTGKQGEAFRFPYDLPPASTGIGMTEGNFVMECLALDVPKDSIEIKPLNNPEQIDAHAYTQEVLLRGAAAIKAAPLFSRGMSICLDYKMLLISGTASIKGQATICLGDAEGQTRTTLENIDLVLNQAQASLKDVQQVRVYIKSSTDPKEQAERADTIKRVVEEILPRIPKQFLIADVCRDNLLVEIEALSFVRTA